MRSEKWVGGCVVCGKWWADFDSKMYGVKSEKCFWWDGQVGAGANYHVEAPFLDRWNPGTLKLVDFPYLPAGSTNQRWLHIERRKNLPTRSRGSNTRV